MQSHIHNSRSLQCNEWFTYGFFIIFLQQLHAKGKHLESQIRRRPSISSLKTKEKPTMTTTKQKLNNQTKWNGNFLWPTLCREEKFSLGLICLFGLFTIALTLNMPGENNTAQKHQIDVEETYLAEGLDVLVAWSIQCLNIPEDPHMTTPMMKPW